jgi:anti-sigma factor RsiW
MEHTEAVNIGATERYLLGELSDDEGAAFEEHFFSCPDCAADVRAAAAVVEGAEVLLRDEPSAAPAAPRARVLRGPASWFWPMPLGAAAALLLSSLGLGYQRLVALPQARAAAEQARDDADAPQPMYSRTLGSMRAASDPVEIPAGIAIVGLKLTVGGDTSPVYRARVERDGRLVDEFDLPHPDPADEPALKVGRRRWPGGNYRVTLREVGQSDGAPPFEETYEFSLRWLGD